MTSTKKWAHEANTSHALARTPDATTRRAAPPTGGASQQRFLVQSRIRMRLVPHLWAGLTVLVGTAGWGLGALFTATVGATSGYVTALVVVALVALVHGGVFAYWRRTAIPRRRFATGAAVSTLWVGAASTFGVGMYLLAGLVAAELVLAAGWWRALRPAFRDTSAPADTPAMPALPPSQPPVAELDRLASKWASTVATNSAKGLPDSRLTDGAVEGSCYSWTLELHNGETLATAQGRIESITSLMGLKPGDIQFDGGDQAASHLIRLQIMTETPLADVLDWDAPTAGNGMIEVGYYADMRGTAPAAVLSEDGVLHTTIVASSGYGKSSLIDSFVASVRANWPTVTMHLDPKRNSSPDLADNATVAAPGLDQAEEFTATVEHLMTGRGLESDADADKGFTPTADRPLYLIVIDECDMLFNPNEMPSMARRWAQIAKTGRSLGFLLLLATQIGEFRAFGSNELLRSNIKIGNLILLRTESNTSDNLIGGHTALPPSRTLPGVGWAYVINDYARRMQVKVGYLPDRKGVETGKKKPNTHGWTAAGALSTFPDGKLCEIGRIALKRGGFDPNLTPQQRSTQRRADAHARLAAWKAGTTTGTDPDHGADAGEVSSAFGDIPGVPGGLSLSQLQADMAAFALDAASLSETDRGVLASVEDGLTKGGDIVASCGFARDTTYTALRRLKESGWVHNPTRGVWQLTTAAQTALTPAE